MPVQESLGDEEPVEIAEKYDTESDVVFFHGDARDLLPQIPDKSIQLIVTSPPYNIGKEYEETKTLDQYKEFQKEVIDELVGRYGKHLTGSDVQADGEPLDSLEFDEETRELLGLDDIAEIIGQIDEAADVDIQEMEQEAEAVTQGGVENIKSADEVIQDMDEDELETETEPE